MIMSKLFFLITVLFLESFSLFSQTAIDNIFIFKTSIYLDKSITFDSNQRDRKEMEDFQDFIKNVEIKPLTLESNIDLSFIFLSLDVSDSSQLLCNNNFCHFIYFYKGANDNTKYTLCINKKNGQIYRLKGFNQLDIQGFMEAILIQYNLANNRHNIKKIIKNYWINEIELDCLWKSIDKLHDVNKYPCTYRSSDNLIIIK
jgi:hypothetical protein